MAQGSRSHRQAESHWASWGIFEDIFIQNHPRLDALRNQGSD